MGLAFNKPPAAMRESQQLVYTETGKYIGQVGCTEFQLIIDALKYYDGFDDVNTKPLAEKLEYMRASAHELYRR